jgi:membrane associated rhomboid family serine protease
MALGYEHAPISQILSLSVLVLGLLFGSPDDRSNSILASGSNILRFLGKQLVFENMAQTIVGVMLLYTFRQFERQMGSRKFGVFVLMSAVSTVICEVIFAGLMGGAGIRFVPASGPYSIIFSLLVMFYCEYSPSR